MLDRLAMGGLSPCTATAWGCNLQVKWAVLTLASAALCCMPDDNHARANQPHVLVLEKDEACPALKINRKLTPQELQRLPASITQLTSKTRGISVSGIMALDIVLAGGVLA